MANDSRSIKLTEDSTDLSLFVRNTEEEFDELQAWNNEKIVAALKTEANMPDEIASEIAKEVYEVVKRSGLKKLSTVMIRELVNVKLLERGYKNKLIEHARFGLARMDVEKIAYGKTKENANVDVGPESIHKYMADAVSKQYALDYLFPVKCKKSYLSDAHLTGDIHIHDLDYFITRPYCMDGNECVNVKKDGEELLIPLGKLIDENINGTLTAEVKGVTITDISEKNLEILSKPGYVRIKKIMRRKADESLLNIRTKSGKSLLLTRDHVVFTAKGEAKVGQLKEGDELVQAVPDYSETKKMTHVDLVKELKNERLYIRGIKKQVKEKAKAGKIKIRETINAPHVYASLHRDSFPIKNAERFNCENARIGAMGIKETIPAKLEITKELAYLLGYFVGDGCYHIQDKKQYTLSITTKDDAAKIKDILEKLGINYSEQETKSNCSQIYFGNKLWVLVFNKAFGIGRKAKNKTIPKQAMRFKKEELLSFLHGLYDSDGSYYANKKIGYQLKMTSSSRALIDQLQTLLSSLGISAYQSAKLTPERTLNERKLPESRGYILRITSKKEIEKLWKGEFSKPLDSNDKITKITKQQPTTPYLYDIEVDEPHGISLNGLFVHNCAGHDIRYLLKFGLKLGKRAAMAKPANTPEVLILHSAKWLGIMQANFSGAQAYSSFNTLVAPFLKGLNEKQYKQLAQMFVFEMAQMSVARGAQVVFSDVSIDYGVPDILADAPAYGVKGKIDGTYADYYDESVKFADALLDVYGEGDARGVPFVFPKPLLKIRKENLKDPNFDEYLLKAHEVSAKMGSPYYLNQVTYEDESISMCCRLKYKVRPEDLDDIKNARMRSTAIQNVTINLPRLAYVADGDDNKLQQLLEDRMEKAKEVHEIKNAVTQKLMDAGNAPMLTANLDGYPYLRMDKVRHLIGILGLNEMVQYHTGEQLHESKEAVKFGWSFIRRMKEITDRFTSETNHVYGLEQTPAESTCYRFAKLDLKYFNGQAAETVKGNLENGDVYYTNSTHFSTSANVPLADKIKDEGLFHPLIEAGAISHVWLGEASPEPEALMNFTKKMMNGTMNQQFAYTRDICHCNDCGHTYGGTF